MNFEYVRKVHVYVVRTAGGRSISIYVRPRDPTGRGSGPTSDRLRRKNRKRKKYRMHDFVGLFRVFRGR